MDISGKMGYAKQLVDTIAGHDDAPEDEVAAALTEARDYVQGKLDTLTADRAARAPASTSEA